MGIRDRAYAGGAKSLAAVMPRVFARRVHQPTFFIGCGRSGTTLLARILATNPEIAVYPYEGNELWHPGAFPWYRSDRRTLPIWADPYGFTDASLERRTPRDDRRLRAVFGAYQTLAGGRSFVNKTVLVTFMIEHIGDLFPGARFLHVCRDGRAVALSFARKELRRIDQHPAPYEASGIRFSLDQLIEAFGAHWEAHVTEIERQREAGVLTPANFHELRYEDFCRSPDVELSRIASFLEVDDRFDLERFVPINDMNEKVDKELDRATVSRLTERMQPALELKGYATSSVTG